MTSTRTLQRPVDTLYILAAGHSGSTLLNLLLGSHPQAHAVSEITYFAANILHNEPCTCGKSIRACELWRGVAHELEKKLGFDVLAQPERLDLGYVDAPTGVYQATRAYRAAWKIRRVAAYASMLGPIHIPTWVNRRFHAAVDNKLALYEAIRVASGTRLIVDSSKDYVDGYEIYRRRPAQTRLILLTRDGRAVFNSNLRRGFGRDYALRVWRNYYRFAPLALGRAVNRSDVYTMRYEDLATNPTAALRGACDFLQLDFDPRMLDTSWRTHHITSGNNMRFGATGVRLDVKWRSELSAANRAFFERHAGALNRSLGYE
jgi:hypothetical protein